MTIHRPAYADAKTTLETETLVLRRRLARAHRILTAGGIWPLTSYRNAEFMVNELRVPVPQEYMDRMRRADSTESARAEGISIAQEMTRRVRRLVQGAQLSAPFGRYEMAVQVAEALGER